MLRPFDGGKDKGWSMAKRTVKDKGPDMEALRRHIRLKGADYLTDPNVTSVGIGRKNGTGPICLQFTVRRKGESAIETLGTARIPEAVEVDGVRFPTDVVQRDYEPSYEIVEPGQLDDRRLRVDPIRPGISVSHVAGTAGTLGLIVRDRATGAPCILSNWHVLHGAGGAIGDRIVQPGPYDDNEVSKNCTGTLLRSHLGAAGDGALARIAGRGHDPSVLGLDVVPRRMARVDLDDRVVKSGRTTGITHGIVRRVDVMVKLDYGLLNGPQAIGGFEIGADPDRPAPEGELSMGGDSGAAWLIADGDAATDIFAGLHFAGEADGAEDEHALACYPASLQKKLDFVLDVPAAQTEGMDTAVPRTGYDPDFLGLTIPEPGLSTALKRDAVNFEKGQTIPYTHFSVCLSASRRMARYVAWNIDGARIVKLPRTGFALDPRIDEAHQWGNELYSGNNLDRGHIARRADLCWGEVEEARQANRDSFFYTNIAPQHQGFNQSSRSGLWGELEDHVFEGAEVADLRLSVQGGPIFADDDINYREARIPRAFWKLVAWRAEDGEPRLAAFILTQADLLNDLEALSFEPFRLYQVGLDELAERTGLDFEGFPDADLLQHPERAGRPSAAEALATPRGQVLEIRRAEDLLI